MMAFALKIAPVDTQTTLAVSCRPMAYSLRISKGNIITSRLNSSDLFFRKLLLLLLLLLLEEGLLFLGGHVTKLCVAVLLLLLILADLSLFLLLVFLGTFEFPALFITGSLDLSEDLRTEPRVGDKEVWESKEIFKKRATLVAARANLKGEHDSLLDISEFSNSVKNQSAKF